MFSLNIINLIIKKNVYSYFITILILPWQLMMGVPKKCGIFTKKIIKQKKNQKKKSKKNQKKSKKI